MASRSRLGIRCLLLLPPSSVQCVSFLPAPSSRPIETDDARVIEIHLSNIHYLGCLVRMFFCSLKSFIKPEAEGRGLGIKN